MRFICLPWMSLPLPSTAGWKCIANHVPNHLKPSFLAVWAVSEPYFEVFFHQTLQISTSKALMALLHTRSTSLFGSFLEGDCPKSLVDNTKKHTCRWKAQGLSFWPFPATLAALLGALVQLAGLKKSLFGCHPRHSNTWKRCVDFAQKHWNNNDVVFFLCADNDNSLRFCGVVSAFRDVQSKSNSANKPHQEMPKQKG